MQGIINLNGKSKVQKLNVIMKLAGKAGRVSLRENESDFVLECWWNTYQGGFTTDEYFTDINKLKNRIHSLATAHMQRKSDEECQLEHVKNYGERIKHIKTPSESVQLAAVTQNGWAIQWIENPSERVKILAELCKEHVQ